MKRRNVLMGSAAVLSAAPITKFNIARAAGAPDPNRLSQDLTPIGAERAGNAAGTIPAWTGGVTEPPPGWSKGDIPADLFGDEQPLYVITQANMDQYADLLADSQKAMLNQYGAQGWKMKVYKTHRTAAYPQYYYDNSFKNVTRVQPVAEGIVNGFTGASGGMPFPMPSDDPAVAGAQIIWNHTARYYSPSFQTVNQAWVCGNGQRIMTAEQAYYGRMPYDAPDTTVEQIDGGYFQSFYLYYTAPPNQLGAKFETSYSFQPLKYPNTAYEYLIGEGRIREAPQAQYDIPIVVDADALNYDEPSGFSGALDRYDWKLVGKKEMLISYNNHAIAASSSDDIFLETFINPEISRWELHRCWIVEATLAPGKRNTIPFRRLYVDEDTWCIGFGENYDAQGHLWKFTLNYACVDPSMPGVRMADQTVTYNLQSRQYAANFTRWPLFPGGISYAPLPASLFQPQNMANNGGL